MADRQVFVALGTADGDGDVTHGRIWAALVDEEALEKFARSLTGLCGEPVEWLAGDGETGGRLSMLFLEGGSS